MTVGNSLLWNCDVEKYVKSQVLPLHLVWQSWDDASDRKYEHHYENNVNRACVTLIKPMAHAVS